jgi:hypothetical protein
MMRISITILDGGQALRFGDLLVRWFRLFPAFLARLMLVRAIVVSRKVLD